MTASADDHQLRAVRDLGQGGRGALARQQHLHRHLGVSRLPRGQLLGQPPAFQRVLIGHLVTEHRHVAQVRGHRRQVGPDHHQGGVASRRGGERGAQCPVGGRGVVDPGRDRPGRWIVPAAHHHDRAVGVGHYPPAHRTGQQPGEPTPLPVADHQLGRAGREVEQLGDRAPERQVCSYVHSRRRLQGGAESLLGHGASRAPGRLEGQTAEVVSRNRPVPLQDVHDAQRQVPAGGLARGPADRGGAVVGAVGADENPSSPHHGLLPVSCIDRRPRRSASVRAIRP